MDHTRMLFLSLCSFTVLALCMTSPVSDFEKDRQRFVELARELDDTVQKLENDIENDIEKKKKCQGTFCIPGGAIDQKNEQEDVLAVKENPDTKDISSDDELRELIESLLAMKSQKRGTAV